MTYAAREKVSMFSHVDINQVICIADVNNIYKVPMMLYDNKVAHWLADRFSLHELTNKLANEPPISPVPNRNNSINIEDNDLANTQHIMQK